MELKLYIAGTQVDLNSDNLILWNYTQEDLANPAIVKNSYSQQITLPGTPTNNALFGDIYRLDRSQLITGSEGGVAFNPSKRTSFEIRNDKDEVLESGYMKLDKVTKKGGTQEYAITLYGGLGSFFYALSYDDNGNKRTLADLRYLSTGNKDNELDFLINASFVQSCWSRLDGDDPDYPEQVADVINFAPCYNGIPDNFDANKGLIDPATCGLPTSVLVDGVTYTTKGGYTLVELPEAVTEWAAKDLRSYLQRPVFSIKAFLNALTNPDNCGGYSFDCSELMDSHFTYSGLWMTLPLLPSLPTYRRESHTLNLTTSGGVTPGDNYIPITLGETLPANTKVDINYNVKLAFYCPDAASAGAARISLMRNMHTQSSSWNYYNQDAMGLFVQLVAYDAQGNPLTASRVVCIGSYEGQRTSLGVTTGIPKSAKERARIVGFTPHFTDLEDVWGDYISASPNADNINRRLTTNYYDFPQELSFSLSAYDIASLRLYVTPYHWYNYHKEGWWPWQRHTDKGGTYGINAQKVIANGVKSYTGYAGAAGTQPNTAEYQTSDTLRSGAKITKASLLSTDYTPADLLLSLTKMFGFTYTYDRATKRVKVMHRNSFYQDETIDLSGRIDRSKDISINPLVFDTKWLSMETEMVGGEFADTYEALYGVPFGVQRIDTGYDFNAETKALMSSIVVKGAVTSLEYGKYYNDVTQDGVFRPSPFLTAGCKHTLWSTGGISTELDVPVPPSPVIYYYGEEDAALPGYDYALDRKLQLHDEDNKPIDGDGILVILNSWGNLPHFKVTDDNATMNNLNDGKACWYLTDGPVGAGQLRIPIFSRYYDGNGWSIQASLDFGRTRELNAPGLVYSNKDVTIYERGWKRYLTDRYDVNTRVVTCYVDLRGMRVGQEMLRKFYHFDNALWVLNKIVNYSLTSNAPVQCEFVKVQDKSAYTEGQNYGLEHPFYEEDDVELSGSVVKWLKGTNRIGFYGDKTNSTGAGYGYVKLRILRECNIYIAPSTEASFDIGYICKEHPCLTKTEIENDADLYTSGASASADFHCAAGDTLYIGYTKDSTAVNGDDKVIFYFNEI